jgi:SAM-dependent methyltransferase
LAERVRVTPGAIHLRDRRGAFEVDLDLSGLRAPTVTVDVYGYQTFEHPNRHLGWWRFGAPADRARLDVSVDLGGLGERSVCATGSAGPLPLQQAWVNPDYVVEPVQNCLVLVREEGSDEPVHEGSLLLNETDRAVLARYAEHVHRVEGYRPRLESAREFVLVFHGSKLRQLRRIFGKYLPWGALVADVGAGRSLFTELVEWKLWSGIPYRLVCSDVAVDVMAERKTAFPTVRWLGADTTGLPFGDGTFDALFAGEILEHVADPAAVLAEWARLVRPGGVLVVTTPNRKRITNRVNRSDTPMGPDHVSELTFDEALALFSGAGLQMLETCGVYLELDLEWRSKGLKSDLAPMRKHFPGREVVLKSLNLLARPFPRFALDVIYVARKPA